MDNIILTSLLQDYSRKRQKAIEELNIRRNEIYSKNSKLGLIEDEINKTAIESSKSVLISDKTKQIKIIKELNTKMKKLRDERKSLLKTLGKDESYLTPVYECITCKDTGYFTDKHFNTIMCNCLKQAIFNVTYNKSNMSNLQKENFDTFNFKLYSNSPDNVKFKTTISPRDNIETIVDISKSFINNFDNPEEKNLFFVGNSGLGKTFLCNCIANEILKKEKTVLYQTASNLLDTIIDYKFGKHDISKEIYDNIYNVDLLIIDDLGTESINGYKISELFNLLNARLLNQNNKITKTIISTNLSLSDLFTTYEERIVSRIGGCYTICKFYGDDIRLRKSPKGTGTSGDF